MSNKNENVKFVRVLLYEGPRKWVEATLEQSISGVYFPGREGYTDRSIIEITRFEITEETDARSWFPEPRIADE